MIASLLKWALYVSVAIMSINVTVVLHEFAHWGVAKWRGFETPEFSLGLGARRYVLCKRWHTTFVITPILIGGYVQLIGATAFQKSSHYVWERLLVMVAGVVMNFFIATALMFTLYIWVGAPTGKARITQVLADSPAEHAGIRRGDVIEEVAGHKVRNADEVPLLISSAPRTLSMVIRSSGSRFSVTLSKNTENRIGTALAPEMGLAGLPPSTAAMEAVQWTADTSIGIVSGLTGMVEDLLGAGSNSTNSSPRGELAGPIGMVTVLSRLLNTGVAPFLSVLAYMNVSWAIFNILPLLPLDGGHVLMLVFAAITRRKEPVPEWVAGLMATPVVLGMLVLMGFATFGDIVRLIPW